MIISVDTPREAGVRQLMHYLREQRCTLYLNWCLDQYSDLQAAAEYLYDLFVKVADHAVRAGYEVVPPKHKQVA